MKQLLQAEQIFARMLHLEKKRERERDGKQWVKSSGESDVDEEFHIRVQMQAYRNIFIFLLASEWWNFIQNKYMGLLYKPFISYYTQTAW